MPGHRPSIRRSLAVMEAPDPAFEITLNAAQGFFRLGMWNDAWNQLEELQPEFRHLPQVMIYNNLENGRRRRLLARAFFGTTLALERFIWLRRTRSGIPEALRKRKRRC
jgi:hypothetical protein